MNKKLYFSKNIFHGFTMIEILVSLLILSLGLLGIAGLQATTSVYKMNSLTINASSLLASDFADRVKANPSAAGSPFWDSFVKSNLYEFKKKYGEQTSLLPLSSLTVNCMTLLCNPSNRATFDLLYWRHAVRALLPQGSTWVVGNRSNGFTVTLMWQDKDYVNAASSTMPPLSSVICETILNPSSVQRSSCCPQGSEAPAGVRCQNFFFLP